MGLNEDREEFKAELEERLETARLKDPQAMWDATVRPWWELAAGVLTRQGYDCELTEDDTGVYCMRVWNDAIGWPPTHAAELIYAWTTEQVEISQRVVHPKEPVAHHAELPVSRLTAEKVREHLRRFIKEIKTYVATLSEPYAE